MSPTDFVSCTNCGHVLANARSAPISRVPGILHTNCVPSDNETVQIHRAVDKVEPEIAQLERDILREQDVLKKLERKREELKV
jgi:hypothetical protein